MPMAYMASAEGMCTMVGTPPNTMVQVPGNLKFTDYLKVGVPLCLVTYVVAVIVIPIVWPF
ncbi:MAG: anion permease [Christensenellaceae bacterium]|nr:anion permease [Christensenellaceae bacterium]